jgi:hypothetical protein
LGDKLRLAATKFAYEGHHDDDEVIESSNFWFTEPVPMWGSMVSVGEISMHISNVSATDMLNLLPSLWPHALCNTGDIPECCGHGR